MKVSNSNHQAHVFTLLALAYGCVCFRIIVIVNVNLVAVDILPTR